MRKTRGWIAALGAWALFAAEARAQSVVVMVPPALEAGASAEDAERVVEAARDQLRAEGFQVISHGQAASAMAALGSEEAPMDASPHECSTRACAARFRNFFDAKLAVRVVVRGHGSADGERVELDLLESDSNYWTGSAEFDGDDVTRACQRALAVAERRRSERYGPWLSVEGEPKGAEVWLDGERVGVLPFDARVMPGKHTIEVRAEGFGTERRTVRIPVSPKAERRLSLVLGPPGEAPVVADAPEGAPPGDQAPQRVRPLYDWVLGGAMIAGGVAWAIAVPAATASRAGQCTNGRADVTSCPEVYGTGDGRVWGQFAVGAAIAAGGVAVLVTRPIQWMMGADRHGASVGVRGTF